MEEIWSSFLKLIEPHWGEIISALIPCAYTFIQGKTLRKEFRSHLANNGNQLDKNRFQKELESILSELEALQKELTLGGESENILKRLLVQMYRVDFYADAIPFFKKDKKAVTSFLNEITEYLSNYRQKKTINWEILPGKIEMIMQILQRGRYSVHV